MTDELDSLKAENDALRKRLEKLEERINPSPRKQSYSAPFDHTAGMSMPASAMRDLANAVPDALMRELRTDARKPNPVTQGAVPQPQPQSQRRGGWVQPRPIEPPPGVALADRLVDAQDEIDKAELAVKLMKAGMLKE
jgi:hypothetical protein